MEGIVMKKIYLTLAVVFALSLNMFAQSDGFFKNYDSDYYNRMDNPNDIGIIMPSSNLGSTQNDPAVPLGNGLLILTAVGLGYAIKKRKE